MATTHFKLLLSILIAGFVMLSVREVHKHLTKASYAKVSDSITTEKADELLKLLHFDLNRIGLGVTGETAIVEAKPQRIVFKSDFDLDGHVETISYYLGNELATATQNPKDRILYRVVDNEPAIDVPMGVTRFEIRYFSSPADQPTTELDKIRTIQVDIVLQNTFAIDDEYNSYSRRLRISPPNLKIN